MPQNKFDLFNRNEHTGYQVDALLQWHSDYLSTWECKQIFINCFEWGGLLSTAIP